MTSEQVIELGGKLWEKAGMSRIYITSAILNKICDSYGRSNYSLNDSKNKIFIEDGKVMRSYKSKKPTLEFSL